MFLPLSPEKSSAALIWSCHLHPCSSAIHLSKTSLDHHFSAIILDNIPLSSNPFIGCSWHHSPHHSRPFMFTSSLLSRVIAYFSYILPLMQFPCTLQSSHKGALFPLCLGSHCLKLLSSFLSGKPRYHLVQEVFPIYQETWLSCLSSHGIFHLPLMQHLLYCLLF